jgi:hypothetical protein
MYGDLSQDLFRVNDYGKNNSSYERESNSDIMTPLIRKHIMHTYLLASCLYY